MVVLSGLLLRFKNSYDMFLNSLLLIGMMMRKVIVFMISKVIIEVRIIFKLFGMYLCILCFICVFKIVVSNILMMLLCGLIVKLKNLFIFE